MNTTILFWRTNKSGRRKKLKTDYSIHMVFKLKLNYETVLLMNNTFERLIDV